MVHFFQVWLCCFTTLLVASTLPNSIAFTKKENGMKSTVYLSPKFELKPGSVINKYSYNIGFPRGHIAIKSVTTELIDDRGNSIPLYEAYIHHWFVFRYHQSRETKIPPQSPPNLNFTLKDATLLTNNGLCGNYLGPYFGFGSETQKTSSQVLPDPYGIEVGNPSKIPTGYEEKWLMNLHVIDTRGVEDRLGCTECRCDLYNFTKKNGYFGGFECCRYDQTQCKLKEGFERVVNREVYFRYIVNWVDWDSWVVPLRIYVLNVADLWKEDNSSGSNGEHVCQLEYEVEPCPAEALRNDNCIDTKRVSLTIPNGGTVVFAVGHQHTRGMGSNLYREDGGVMCSSMPTYGDGNEAGFMVGMSSCSPHPGSLTISDGETLILESNYSKNSARHTGVMGLFYLFLADASPKP